MNRASALSCEQLHAYMHMAYVWLLNEPQLALLAVNRAHAYMHMAYMYMYVWLLNEPHVHVLMRDEKEGRKKQARTWAQPAELPQ